LLCQIQSLDFEISIHNLLFHIEIQLLLNNFKGQSLTVPPSLFQLHVVLDWPSKLPKNSWMRTAFFIVQESSSEHH
jgi:hypothetical protein